MDHARQHPDEHPGRGARLGTTINQAGNHPVPEAHPRGQSGHRASLLLEVGEEQPGLLGRRQPNSGQSRVCCGCHSRWGATRRATGQERKPRLSLQLEQACFHRASTDDPWRPVPPPHNGRIRAPRGAGRAFRASRLCPSHPGPLAGGEGEPAAVSWRMEGGSEFGSPRKVT